MNRERLNILAYRYKSQFIAVIDSCQTVASDTHTKYGIWATATHR